MEASLKTRQAYSEVDEFLSLLTAEEQNAVPKKLQEFFKREKDKGYKKEIRRDVPIKEQNLLEETLAIIALMNLQYWCKDEQEKADLKVIYTENERKYQRLLEEKYDVNNLFKQKETKRRNKEAKLDNTNRMEIIVYKETKLKKLLDKIFEILHIKRS